MNTSKTLMLAGFAVLSLGVGSAMAQEGGSGLSVPGNGWFRATQSLTTQAPAAVSVQSGSSDVDAMRSHNPFSVTAQPQFDISIGGSGG
jgi:hypothetical protein